MQAETTEKHSTEQPMTLKQTVQSVLEDARDCVNQAKALSIRLKVKAAQTLNTVKCDSCQETAFLVFVLDKHLILKFSFDVQDICEQQNWNYTADANDNHCLGQLSGLKANARVTMKAGDSLCEEIENLHAELTACIGTPHGMEFRIKVTQQQIAKRQVCFRTYMFSSLGFTEVKLNWGKYVS